VIAVTSVVLVFLALQKEADTFGAIVAIALVDRHPVPASGGTTGSRPRQS